MIQLLEKMLKRLFPEFFLEVRQFPRAAFRSRVLRLGKEYEGNVLEETPAAIEVINDCLRGQGVESFQGSSWNSCSPQEQQTIRGWFYRRMF